MGWNSLKILDSKILNKKDINDVYFIHTYHAIPEDSNVISATVVYGEDVVASVQKDNIFATQFHPEKSQTAGLSILKNYFGKYA